MELLKHVPRDGFVELEARMGNIGGMDLELFTDIMTEVGHQFQFLKEHGTSLGRSAIRKLFHAVDFRSFKVVTWEMLTMHIIDDAFLAAATSQGDVAGDAALAGNVFTKPEQEPQHPTSRVRRVEYVAEWDRMIKVVERTTGMSWLEITTKGSCSVTAKTSVPYASPISCFAPIPSMGMIAAYHNNLKLALFSATLSNDRPGNDDIAMTCLLGNSPTEIEENIIGLRYHKMHRLLFAGTRNGSLYEFDMSKQEHAFNAKLTVARRNRGLFSDSLSCMVPMEERLVVGSMQTKKNVKLFDLEKHTVVEEYNAHALGVLTMTLSEPLGLLVTAGFERTPFAWVFKIRDFPPWKLLDRAQPHKGDIVQVECPSDTYHCISSDDRGIVKVWDVRTFRCLQTTYGDQPTGKHAQDAPGSLTNHFHSATFHESAQTIISVGPQNVTEIAVIAPQNLDCCDDDPVAVMFYIPSHRVIVTGHARTVKVWAESTGSVMTRFNGIAKSELTAMCCDSTGRKLYLGTRAGTVTGHSITTGSVYRNFKTLSSEVVQLQYNVYRSAVNLLVAVSLTDLVLFEDRLQDGHSTYLPQPLQMVKMDIVNKYSHDLEAAQRKIKALAFRGVVTSSKLSLFFVWAGRHVLGVDFGNYNVVHTFVVEHDVGCVCFLGDLPAIAVLDRKSVVSIFAIRPSLSAPDLLARKNLSEPEHDTSHRKSVTLMSTARRMTAKDNLETQHLMELTNQSKKDDDETLLGHVDTSMTFCQALSLLVIADAQGFCWQWSLTSLIEVMSLFPCAFPHISRYHANYARRPKRVMDPLAAGKMLTLVKGFKAHDEESRGVAIIDTLGATKILTAGNDRMVKVWSRKGVMLGALCQGRFRGEEGRNPMILKAFNERNNITPFNIQACLPDKKEEFRLTDIPQEIVPMLRRVARRFAAHLEADRSEKLLQSQQVDEELQQLQELQERANLESAGTDRMEDSLNTPTALSRNQSMRNSKSCLMYGAATTMHWNATNVDPTSPPTEGSVPVSFSDKLETSIAVPVKKYTVGWETLTSSQSGMVSSSEQSTCRSTDQPLRSKLRFSARGAAMPAGHLQRSSKVEAPTSLEHSCLARLDVPITPLSHFAVAQQQTDIHDRTVCETMGMEWALYEKALDLCDKKSRMRDPMTAVKDAVRLRMAGDNWGRPVPAVPPLATMSTPTPKPMRPRLPETARETERRAVSRLLGEATPRQNSARF